MYEFRCAYYSNPSERRILEAFVRHIFGLDLSGWSRFEEGLDYYTPFSYFEGQKVVANVAASPMNLTVAGRRIRAVQVGTVACLPELRRQGLVRELFKRAHAHWEGRCEFMYLFANESARGFYRQFGYRAVRQYKFRSVAPVWESPGRPAVFLDLANPRDRRCFLDLAIGRAAVSNRIGVHGQGWLLLFHALMGHATRVQHIAPLESVILSEIRGNTLHLIDVVGERIPTFAQLYPYIGTAGLKEVVFHFTPDLMNFEEVLADPDSGIHLFVHGPIAIENEPFAFPATSVA